MWNQVKTAPWVVIAAGFHQKGGMDKANHALADYLLEREIPVHLVTHSADPGLQKHPLATVHIVARPGNSFYLGEFALAATGRKVARDVLRKNPSAQIVSNGGNCVWPGINWAHYVHCAWTAPKRGPISYRLKDALASRRARRTEKAAFQKARIIISNSKRTTAELVKYFGVQPDRVHTVYLGTEGWGPISPEERASARKLLQVTEDRPLAAFVGALGYDDRKGFDVLFGAWKQLCAKPEWDVDLVAAGSGPAVPAWQSQIKAAGLEQRIRLLGFTEDVKTLLAASDVLVSPVRYESYGLNVQEAICRGIPAVVTASAGVAEQYAPEFAPLLLPNAENIQDLVERLLGWRAKQQHWLARFQRFGERLRNRSWRDTAADFVSIVEHQRPAESAALGGLVRYSNS